MNKKNSSCIIIFQVFLIAALDVLYFADVCRSEFIGNSYFDVVLVQNRIFCVGCWDSFFLCAILLSLGAGSEGLVAVDTFFVASRLAKLGYFFWADFTSTDHDSLRISFGRILVAKYFQDIFAESRSK